MAQKPAKSKTQAARTAAKNWATNSKWRTWMGNLGSQKILLIGFIVTFGGLGLYMLMHSFAATPENFSSSSASTTIASWNTFVDNKTQLNQVVPTLMQTADIIGMQEVHKTAQRNAVKKLICATCAYDGVMYKNKNTKKTIDPRGGYPILWKRDVFERVDKLHIEKMASKVKVNKTIRFKARYAAWTILKDKRTGQQIIVINTHTYAKAEYQGKPRVYAKVNQGYKNQMVKLQKLVAKLQTSKNLPIFVIGDLNVDYRYDNGSVAYFPKAMLGAKGFTSNWSAANYPEVDTSIGTAPSEDTVISASDEEVTDTVNADILGTLRVGAGGRIIDYVYAWNRPDVTLQSTIISEATYGSDHAPIFATYTISNLTTSAGSAAH